MTKELQKQKSKENMETLLIHPPHSELPVGNRALVPGIEVSTKFTFEKFEDLENLIAGKGRGYLYSRVMNPTVHSLEMTLAKLQGVEAGLCTSSGVSAISTLMFTLLKAGDHIVYFIESYKPTRYIIEKFLGKWGIKSTILSIRDHTSIETALSQPNTKLAVFESPTNPLLHIADIEFISKKCREVGAYSVLDNTFAGFHNHANLGVDIFIHSLTKFAGGHSDTMGGAILSTEKIIDSIRWPAAEIGAVLDPATAHQIQKGLKTYSLRYERACENALKIANFLEGCREVSNVRYPGLDSHPQKSLADKQQKDSGTIVSFDLDKALSLPDFFNSLNLFKVSPSLGCVESLAAPVNLFYGGLLSEENKVISEISENSIRLSIGIENVDDLLTDLKKSLRSC